MNRHLWENRTFRFNKLPPWPCPNCSQAALRLEEETFKFKHTLQSIKDRKTNTDWDPEWEQYRVICFLNCQNCSENVAVIGIGTNKYYNGTNANGTQKDWYEKIYEPLYFIPSLNIVDAPVDRIKTSILMELEKAFCLFWSDNSSCANKIRNVVEKILDEQKVRKVYKARESNKEKKYVLHKRLELYRDANKDNKKYFDVANHLMAIKFIGNPASHSTNISNKAVLDAFELLEYCLKKLYDNEDERIMKLSNMINKRKAPIG